MKTFSAKAHEVKRDWFVVDATDLVLGRLASEIGHRLRGKHKTIYTPHVDTGEQLLKCKRHHIPIVTHPMVMFYVGGEQINMLEGDVWEINNSKLHQVKNYSNIDRIHIIIDWDLNLEY